MLQKCDDVNNNIVLQIWNSIENSITKTIVRNRAFSSLCHFLDSIFDVYFNHTIPYVRAYVDR